VYSPEFRRKREKNNDLKILKYTFSGDVQKSGIFAFPNINKFIHKDMLL